MLVTIPLFDATMNVRPLQLADERWRFGAIGTLSNITLVPLLGLFLAIAIATMTELFKHLFVIIGLVLLTRAGLADRKLSHSMTGR